ncbi:MULTISPECIES: ABC transporter ATP-binding protein [Alphaproteobacteria]|uniref:ABC transporter ATP-binding protein n=1 Tax=Alphaproteobacteria TaxID=28211 RepID=UPI00326601E3
MSDKTLTISHLSAGYKNREIIHDLSLPPLEAGTITAVIGPNGAGKTTLLRALGGLLPGRGEVLYGGRNLLLCKPAERAHLVTYMPQTLPQGVALTVIEAVITALRAAPGNNVETEAGLHAQADAALEHLGIGQLALSGIDELSGGQRQLVSLAQSIVRRPKILLLDEPTSALDPHHQLSVMGAVRDHVRSREAIAIIVLHDLNLALQWADNAMLLKDGILMAAGRPNEAVTANSLADAYGVAARVEHCSQGRPHILFDGLL